MSSPAARAMLALLAGRGAFGLAYLASAIGAIPIVWYHPLERRFSFAVRPPGFAMDWYGRTALALTCGALVAIVAYGVTARGTLARLLERRSVVLAVARATGLVVLVDFVYFGWVLLRQTPAPLPLPPWYCPR